MVIFLICRGKINLSEYVTYIFNRTTQVQSTERNRQRFVRNRRIRAIHSPHFYLALDTIAHFSS